MARSHVRDRVVVRGAGEMASGVIRRLFITGHEVVALEQAAPCCIRRKVCFAEAIFEGQVAVEGVSAVLADSVEGAVAAAARGCIPVLVDPQAELLPVLRPLALVDARMLKTHVNRISDTVPIVIGLGPGFVASQNCDAVIETNRGFDLGRVIYEGSPRSYTGVPTPIEGISHERVLRSPADGELAARCAIGDLVTAGQIIADVGGVPVASQIQGVVRGLVRDGLRVSRDQKVGDIDPRGINEYCYRISEKANAVGGGVLEALLVLNARSGQKPS
jgi:xanthine dehydrogenase accessory factor